MQCFVHHEVAAVGICRTCGKGICPACAREIDRGVVCSDACAQFAIDNQAIVDRAKRVYSIGVKPKIPLGAWFFGTMGVVLLGIAGLLAWSDPNGWPAAAYPGGFGLLLLVFAVFVWRRYRAIGLNL
jgi:hypothetical protein